MFWKKLIVVLLILLLSGCAGQAEPMQCALDFRTDLMEAEACSFSADITAHYPDRLYTFSLRCAYGEEQTTMTVTQPACLSGITAVAEKGRTQLEYDGIILEFGDLANGSIAPAEAPWVLLRSWTGAYIAYAGSDEMQTRVSYLQGYQEDELSVDTWFSDSVPVYAEISHDGIRCITVELTDFQLTPGGAAG